VTLFAIAKTENSLADAFSVFALSTKIFTVFPWVVDLKRIVQFKTLAWLFLLVLVSTIFMAAQTHPDQPLPAAVTAVIHDWAAAASSGAKYLPAGLTRGPKNHSLSAFTCRLLEVPADDTRTEVFISLLFFALAAFVLWKHRFENLFTRFALAFAFTPVAHPLPWLHLFSWTFPLAVLVSQQFSQQFENENRDQRKIMVSGSLLVIALILLTLSSKRVFGDFGDWLEWHAAKGFGVIFLYLAFKVSLSAPRIPNRQ
jgi:hypothetical protein